MSVAGTGRRYRFGGIVIDSAIGLPGVAPALPVDDGRPIVTLTVRQGAVPEPDHVWYQWHQGYRLELGEWRGQWLFRCRFDGAVIVSRDGHDVTLVCPGEAPGPDLVEVLLRRVLTRVPMLFGACAIHAASLCHGGGGILLSGPSGAGKSTLCAHLARTPGWTMMGDDTALMWDATDGAPALGPGAASVCLWPDSRDGLLVDHADCQPLASATGKARAAMAQTGAQAGAPAETAAATALVPVQATLFLDRQTAGARMEPRAERLSPAEAMALVVPQLIRFNPHGDSARERVDAALAVAALLRHRPAYRLVYPGRYDALPAVEAVLRAVMSAPADSAACHTVPAC